MKAQFKLLGALVGLVILANVLPIWAQQNLPAKAGQAAMTDQTPQAIPWNQIGPRAGAGYRGNGLTVRPSAEGARLHCVFQRLDGEATDEGLWLTSSVASQAHDRFCVRAIAVGRVSSQASGSRADGAAGTRQDAAPQADPSTLLVTRGTVSVEGRTVRYSRPGLTEEYSVSMDGVRQDFVVTKKPPGRGELQVRLKITGAKVEALPGGARLVLAQSGRRIAYSRLHATDATGRELAVRMEATSGLVFVVNDKAAVYPVRIDPTFSDANWISLGSELNVIVYALAVSGNTLYAGGDLTTAANSDANSVMQWDGTNWSELGSGMNYSVLALAVSENTLYAGGSFTTVTNSSGVAVPANYIAQWNGTNWSELGSGMNGPVFALAVSGNTLYAGGSFTTVTNSGGVAVPANYITQWNGSSWSALGSGMNSDVFALAVTGNTLYAGGHFYKGGGVWTNNIAQWNGSSWSALGWGMGGGMALLGPRVNALALLGNTLYVGGDFTTVTNSDGVSVAANYIAQWNGTNWSALGSGMNNIVYGLAISGNTLYASGHFTTAGGISANYIVQWNGTDWSALGSGMNGRVNALAVSGNTLYAGGNFTTAGTNVSAFVAEAILNPANWLNLQADVPGPGTNTLTYVGLPTSQYLVQYTTNLTTSPWFTLATNTPSAYGVGTVQDPTATDPQRFYRLSGP